MLPKVDSINQAVPPAANYEAPVKPDAEKPVEAVSPKADEKQEAKSRRSATEAIPAREQPERRDQVEIHFALSREEREAFAAALSSQGNPAETMTEEEKRTVQKASERITKFIDDTVARNQKSREKVESAVSEWYSKMSRGEPRGPFDLIQLLRAAAMGNLDELGN